MTLAEYVDVTPPTVRWAAKVHVVRYRGDLSYLRAPDGGMDTICGKQAPGESTVYSQEDKAQLHQGELCVSCYMINH